MTDATLHDLRHTRITELANLLPMHQVMQLSGHKTTQMLTRYYNPDMQDLGELLRSRKQRLKSPAGLLERRGRKRQLTSPLCAMACNGAGFLTPFPCPTKPPSCWSSSGRSGLFA